MSTQTTNYGLVKPDVTEFYDVNVMNDNFGVIDEELKKSADHITNKSNPHSITASQVGLGNVPNVATNDQTPTYTAASSNTALVSGEKLSVAFGKIAKAVSSLISHLGDTVGHITSAERTKWNAKLDATGTAVNADKLDGYHASSFITKDSNNAISIVPTFAGGVGGLEGGEIHLAKAPDSTVMTGDVTIDVVDKSVRIFCQATSGIKILRMDFSTVGADSVLLHTGTSAPVKIQDTAPTDTTALWVS